MPKRPIYLQPPDDVYRRNWRDLEFLCNYWDRLLAANRSYDVRLPELLRANHLIRQLSSLPSNRGLRVNVSFTILDGSERLEPENGETYQLRNTSPYIESHNAFHRSPCNGNTIRCNDLLRNYVRQMNENYAAIERELMRARVSASHVERDRFRASACNWNRSPAANRTCSARIPTEMQERHVGIRERSNQACALYQHGCCMIDSTNNGCCMANRQSIRQRENFTPEEFKDLPKSVPNQHRLQVPPQIYTNAETIGKLQSNNNTLPNHAGTVLLNPNSNATIKPRKESMEARQDVGKIIDDAAKIPRSTKSPKVKRNDDDDVAINKSDSQAIDRQENVPRNVKLDVATNQSGHAEGRGNKRKLDDLEDREAAAELNLEDNSRQDRSRIGKINPRVKNAPTIFFLDEKAIRDRIGNGMMPAEEKSSSSRRHVSSPKYASFLRMFRKEEADERTRGNSSSPRDDGKKLQRRRGPSAENGSTTSNDHDNRTNMRNKRRAPTPRSTVHTTYNPIMQSSVIDPVLDPSGITTYLLRLAVLLYAPALMPALNSLIAQQNQTPISMASSFERSNDLLTQIYRLFNEQQSIPNLPFAPIATERVPTAVEINAETNNESSQLRSDKEEENNSIATERSPATSKEESISTGIDERWKSNDRVQQQNGRDGKWRLTSTLTDFGVKLDRNIFGRMEDFRRFEEILRTERQHTENIRSLSTRNRNEIITTEYFQEWLRRLLRQLNSMSNNLSSNDEETARPVRSSRIGGESVLEETSVTGRENTDTSSDSSKEDENTFTEHEDEDFDDQKSFASTFTNTNSSGSLQLQRDDAGKDDERAR